MLRHARPLILVIALLGGGCGSGSATTTGGATTEAGATGTSTTASTPSTRTVTPPGGKAGAALVASADPICKQVAEKRVAANSTLEAAAKSGNAASLLEALAGTAPSIASEERNALSQLRALKAPAAMASDWHTMLAGLQKIESNTLQLGRAAKANNNKRGEALTASSKKIEGQLATIGARNGFTYCGPAS